MRNVPSSPSRASDSADEAGLPALSEIMSQMRPSSSPVRGFSLGQDSDGGSGSDSDMYVDEDLTPSVTQEEPEDRFLGAPADSSRERPTGIDPRRDQDQPRIGSVVKQEPDEDAEGLLAPRQSEERRQDANDDVGDEDDDDASYIPADSDASVEKSPHFDPSTGKDLDTDEEREEDELELADGVDMDGDGDEGAHGQGTHTIPSPAPASKTATTRKRKNPFDDMDTGGSTKEEKLNCLKFKKAKRTPVPKSVSGGVAANTPKSGSSRKRKVPVEDKEADATNSAKGDKLRSLKFKKHKPTTSTPDRAPKSDPRPKPTPVPKPTPTSRTVLHPTSAARPDPAPKPLPNYTPSSNTGDCSSSKVASRPPLSVPSAAKERSAPTSSNAKASVKAHKYTKHPTHWHLDGSLLVQIEGVRYRLHRSRVVRASGVVRDVLEGSSGIMADGLGERRRGEGSSGSKKGKEKEGGDKRKGGRARVEYEEDGTPLVFLDGVVEGKDWETLVDAMDAAVTFIYDPPPLPHIASLLRASHFLRVPSFEAYARKAVQDVWSDELDSIRGSAVNDDLDSNASEDIRTHGLSATEAVVLGRLCGLKGVVKRGMYELVKSEAFEQGFSDEDDESDSDSNTSRAGGSRAKENGRKRETLTQKDYMKLTTARSRLLSRWMRETAQFPEELLPCATSTARAEVNRASEGTSGSTDGEAGSEGDERVGEGSGGRSKGGDGEWEGCTGSDPLAAREAHRRLVLQSGVQEAYLNDVVGGLGVLLTLNWGSKPRESQKRRCRNEGRRDTNANSEGEGDGEVYYAGFCQGCVGRLERVWGGARERVWKDFGELFGV